MRYLDLVSEWGTVQMGARLFLLWGERFHTSLHLLPRACTSTTANCGSTLRTQITWHWPMTADCTSATIRGRAGCITTTSRQESFTISRSTPRIPTIFMVGFRMMPLFLVLRQNGIHLFLIRGSTCGSIPGMVATDV